MRIVLRCLLVCALFACKKDECDDAPETPETPSTASCGIVANIHRTDLNGALMFPYDSTDWRITDDWCLAVEELFSDRPPVQFITMPPDTAHIICYPNPTPELFVLRFFGSDVSYVDVRFVNADHQELFGVDSLTSVATVFDGDTLGAFNGQLVRAYYRIVHSDGTAHRGHGDIQLGP